MGNLPEKVMNMPETRYRRGYKYELRAKKDLEKTDHYVVRSAGSHGCIDLVAIDINYVRLIQIKYTSDVAHMPLYTRDMKKLSELQVPSNCRKELWIYSTKTRSWMKEVIE